MKVTYKINQSENVQTEKRAKLSIFFVDKNILYVRIPARVLKYFKKLNAS